MPRRRWTAAIAALLSLPIAPPAVNVADPPRPASVSEAPPLFAPSDPPAQQIEPPDAFTPSPEFQAWITAVAREHLPAQYEKKKNWGHTTKTFDGLSIRVEEGRLETRRKWREANDGSWQMYRVKFKDPEEKFRVRIANLKELPGGRVGMDVTVAASLDVFARQSLWEHGVQLFSVSVEADARVRLVAHVEIATRLDPTRFPPDVHLDPEVKTARLDIPDFKLRRISDFHGPVVRSLSHSAREALEEKVKDDNAKLVAGLNKAIAKQEKKLKLSLADLMHTKWAELIKSP